MFDKENMDVVDNIVNGEEDHKKRHCGVTRRPNVAIVVDGSAHILRKTILKTHVTRLYMDWLIRPRAHTRDYIRQCRID